MSTRTTYEHPDIFLPKLVKIHIEKPRNIDPSHIIKTFDKNENKSYKEIVDKWI